MKTNVKPGDLAIVVTSRIQSNIGKIVTVIGPATRGPCPLSPTKEVYILNGETFVANGIGWIVKCEGSPIYSQYYDDSRSVFSHSIRPVADRYLRPLRDDELQDETETTRELETAS